MHVEKHGSRNLKIIKVPARNEAKEKLYSMTVILEHPCLRQNLCFLQKQISEFHPRYTESEFLEPVVRNYL